MKKYGKIGYTGLAAILAGIAVWIITATNETGIIVQVGIRTYHALQALPLWIFGVGVVLIGLGFKPLIQARINDSRAAKDVAQQLSQQQKDEDARRNAEDTRPALTCDANGYYNPENIKSWLGDLEAQAAKEPELSNALGECLEQLTGIKMRQSKLESMIKVNNASRLMGNSPDILVEVEQDICRSFLRVINYGIVSDDISESVFDEDGGSITYKELVKEALDHNNKLLKEASKFVADAARLISETSRSTVESKLKIWQETFREMYDQTNPFDE